MIAKIVENDKREYYSVVFAICRNGWDTAVVVFDGERNRFFFMKMYTCSNSIVRNVFIIDCSEQDFIKDKVIKVSPFNTIKNINGYDWLVENTELFVDIIKNKKVNEEYREKAIKLNASIELKEWTFVKNVQDVENLMSAAWGFHDGIVEKAVFNSELDNLEVLFSGCWSSRIILSFQTDPAIKLTLDSRYLPDIMSSNIFFENGFVYWGDDESIGSLQQLNEADDIQYFRARTLSWKQETL